MHQKPVALWLIRGYTGACIVAVFLFQIQPVKSEPAVRAIGVALGVYFSTNNTSVSVAQHYLAFAAMVALHVLATWSASTSVTSADAGPGILSPSWYLSRPVFSKRAPSIPRQQSQPHPASRSETRNLGGTDSVHGSETVHGRLYPTDIVRGTLRFLRRTFRYAVRQVCIACASYG